MRASRFFSLRVRQLETRHFNDGGTATSPNGRAEIVMFRMSMAGGSSVTFACKPIAHLREGQLSGTPFGALNARAA